ncbi:hypothetical protein ZWY2020_016569 [Hordeum vulgare]|nr:hypothetical protein ZWY2020_016569 [Hordeum vulgare]
MEGALELASAGIGVAIFNILSKIFNIPLLSIATSFVAEDISKNATKHSTSGKLELTSVSSALVLAAAIGTIEALALFLGSGLFLKLMGVLPGQFRARPEVTDQREKYLQTLEQVQQQQGNLLNASHITGINQKQFPTQQPNSLLQQFNSQSSSIYSQGGLGLGVQGPDAGQTKSDEQHGLADDVGVESAATTGPIKHTNEDDTKAPYSASDDQHDGVRCDGLGVERAAIQFAEATSPDGERLKLAAAARLVQPAAAAARLVQSEASPAGGGSGGG